MTMRRPIQDLAHFLSRKRFKCALLLGLTEAECDVLPCVFQSYYLTNGFIHRDQVPDRCRFSPDAWPFLPGSFDLIVLSDGLAGKQWMDILQQAVWMLAPGGNLIILESGQTYRRKVADVNLVIERHLPMVQTKQWHYETWQWSNIRTWLLPLFPSLAVAYTSVYHKQSLDPISVDHNRQPVTAEAPLQPVATYQQKMTILKGK